jgi:soluble lytic murein transglycosylase-like protein
MRKIILFLILLWLLASHPAALPAHHEYDADFQAAALKYFPNQPSLEVPIWQAARAYAESDFHPNSISPVGALGLMQIMPSTGKELGLTPQQLMDPVKAIYASTAYVKWLTHYFPSIKDATDLQEMTDFSYNAGPGWALKSQLIAKAAGKDNTKWAVDMEFIMTSPASQRQTRDYVARIQMNISLLK